MLEGVQFLGLAVEPVSIGGVSGPDTVKPTADAPLAIFRMDGWQQGETDEKQGHKIAHLMAAVGNAEADGKWSAEEVSDLCVQLQLPGGKVLTLAVPVAEKAIKLLEDDGRLSASDLKSLVGPLLGGLVKALTGGK